MNMEEKLNGWFKVKYGFAKKREEGAFDIIRINNLDDFVHVEFYDKVNIIDVNPSYFERYGTYNEYNEQKSDYEKAMYVAVFSLRYDDSITCYNNKEVKNLLVGEEVLPKEEVFDLSNY